MLMGTFRLDYPILRETLSRVPDATLTWVQSDLTEDDQHKMLVWLEHDEQSTFCDGLEDDPTVMSHTRLTAVNGRQLYHLELTDEGHRESVYPVIVEQGIVLDHVTASVDGWEFRTTFPDHDALEQFRSFCADHDLDIALRQLYEEREAVDHVRHGLTDRQRETLVTAVDAGYLEIPRACSLADLGDQLGISSNAASERFRRGVQTLVRNTVHPDAESS